MLMEPPGAKVYMTRAALRELAAEVLRINDADPEDCFEIHLAMLFSHFGRNDEHLSPNSRFSCGLAAAFDRAQRDHWSADLQDGEVIEWNSAPVGFDVTIMHVSADMVRAEIERRNE